MIYEIELQKLIFKANTIKLTKRLIYYVLFLTDSFDELLGGNLFFIAHPERMLPNKVLPKYAEI